MRWRQCTVLLAALLLSPLLAAGKQDKPVFTHTLFDNLPTKLIYFEDTSVVLYHDAIARNVWRSSDEGKEWTLLDTVPKGEAWAVIEHPFDSRIAFVLSKGKTHYRTMNRGESWQSFDVPASPAIAAEVLSFHSRNWDWIMYAGQQCESLGGWLGKTCYDETYVTQDAFATPVRPMLSDTSRCIWAHATKQVPQDIAKELVYCVAYESTQSSSTSTFDDIIGKIESLASSGGMRSISDSRLYSSTDFFKNEKHYVDMGIGKNARGVVGIGAVKSYLVAALKPGIINGGDDGASKSPSGQNGDEMLLYVTTDGTTWHKGLFPHGHGLRENAYTIVESTQHSILVDVLTDVAAASGTLFTSDSRGTNYVKSLEHTNRNAAGIVDFEKLESIEGVSIANIIANPDEVDARTEDKKLKTKLTMDDGGHWQSLKAPERDSDGKKVKCDVSQLSSCSLHLHSVTDIRNYGRVFSSSAPGLVMGVGSIGEFLQPYDECDTFVSTDAGQTWSMVAEGAHKYEFGAQGSILVAIDDEDSTDDMRYSFDFGKTWEKFDFGVTLRAKLLTTIPDSTSQKFLLLGTLTRKSKGSGNERHIIVHIDFSSLEKRQCAKGDFEKWYAREINGQPDCLMGHKQWFNRRKQDADCVVTDLFNEPVGRMEDCPCSDEDFECDFNYVLDGDECVIAGPQPIPSGACQKEGDKFEGSSGYRLIPGNTCDRDRGIKKDAPKMKDCSEGIATPGKVSHQRYDFPALITEHAYFADSKTVLAFAKDGSVWQSSNEGFSWKDIEGVEKFVATAMHMYSKERAYLFTAGRTVYYTTDKGMSWNKFTAPLEPNSLGIPLLDFHPTQPDWLIWTGSKDCGSSTSPNCRAVAYYSKDNGRNWREIESYVRVCSWARDRRLKIDERLIFCESYKQKSGSQTSADAGSLQLVAGKNFYSDKKVLFEAIVGFATFEEYMIAAELNKATGALTLQVSLDGQKFATGLFPPGMKLENQAYTILESNTDAIFLHVTTHGQAGSEWGSLFKSNSNGTYYSLSLEHVNRNSKGYVDFEKMLGLDGIALMNIVSNSEEAAISGNKKLQSRITHNDGGRWVPITPPVKDSLGSAYSCTGTECSLHFHGYTERKDPRATYSSPTAVGLMLAVGNVGKELAGYTDSDTFLTRDAGFHWEEVHKDAHIWEFGDQGSILIIANDEGPTDRVSYTLDEGLSWSEYVFGDSIRVQSIVTVPQDTSRKFLLLGTAPGKPDATVAIHLDFSKTANEKCRLDLTDANNDDFELWSPSQDREESCLFGRQTLYYRRIRDKKCYIGEKLPQPHSVQRNCMCEDEDFECEFNHVRNARGECVLIDGAKALENDGQCEWGQEYWYERTAYRKVPHSSCEGGKTLDQGKRHLCPGARGHGFFWWAMVLTVPAILAGLAGCWWSRRRSGVIRLGDPQMSDGGWIETLQSIPFYLIGIGSAAWAWLSEIRIPYLSDKFASRRRSRNGYRSVLDDDAALLSEVDYAD